MVGSRFKNLGVYHLTMAKTFLAEFADPVRSDYEACRSAACDYKVPILLVHLTKS